jgi:tetratricopeptide (TPR) repeat protein
VPDTNEQRVARLMAEGLDHYGQDRIDRAAACWRAVLALDPSHEVARDYLEVAGFGAGAASAAAPAAPAGNSAGAAFLREGLESVARGGELEALELLESAVREAPEGLEAHAALDLVRASLYRRQRARTQDGAGVLRVRLGPDDILRFNLPANAGFVLSMIDGHTSADELVALTNMDPFEALHTLGKLLDAGIVEVKA